ncbi:MAG: hypothetical protein HYT08_01750 [Candidatus Levybacteria bacterium]|nr:hypothetical protein [Candidatus Levybacteria bacterium]
MSNFIARIISLFSSPLIILLPAPYILVDKVSNNDIYALKWALFSYIFLFSVVLFVIAGTFLGVFSDFDVSKKEQRPLLFFFSGLVTFFYLASLFVLNGPKILFIAIFAIILGIIVLGIANQWIKVSIHTATVSALSISLAILYGGWFILSLVLIPIMAWSRIKIKKHTPTEAVTGGVLGTIITIIVYIIAKTYLK